MSNDLTPNNKAAIAFLRKWSPEGLWVLTAIHPDSKAIETKTFDEARMEELQGWLEKHNGQRNIYFSVNPTMGEVTKKATRGQIKSLSWLHVDIDPREGEDIELEQKRALNKLKEGLPAGVPEPTCIVFSGGGYQGFWRLNDPFDIDGDEKLFQEAKLWNMKLELLFHADNCHNVDRIMRLPGTINVPDERKRKKGRKPARAKMIEFNDKSYDLAEFKKAPAPEQVQSQETMSFSGTADVSEDGDRIMDLDQLDEWQVSGRVKTIIALGHDPDQPKDKDNSRSSWLYDALCHMARQEVPPEVMFALITDPGWALSESVLEQKDPTYYAKRQIKRAMDNAVDPWLSKLNNKYSVIGNVGGKCMIVNREFEPAIKRWTTCFRTFSAFTSFYRNRKVQVGVDDKGQPKFRKVGEWWLDHERRQQYDSITFAPNQETPGVYNLYQGFACEAKEGDCEPFLAHVRENLCNNDEEHYNYLVGWMARTVQQPDKQGEVAVVLQGGRGVGKSFFAWQLGALFGQHYMAVSNAEHLTGKFNGHLQDVILLFADEAFYANDKKHESILKTLITESTLTVEKKGIDVFQSANYVHLIMASNDQHVVPAGTDERRFFVLACGEDKKQDEAYFAAIAEQMDNGGREALLHYLLEYDLSDYKVRSVPQTDALKSQKDLSLDTVGRWWLDCLDMGRILKDSGGWPEAVACDDFYRDYEFSSRPRPESRRAAGKKLAKLITLQRSERMFERKDEMGQPIKKRLPCFIIPSLKECRAAWERAHGPFQWEDHGELDFSDQLPRDEKDIPF